MGRGGKSLLTLLLKQSAASELTSPIANGSPKTAIEVLDRFLRMDRQEAASSSTSRSGAVSRHLRDRYGMGNK